MRPFVYHRQGKVLFPRTAQGAMGQGLYRSAWKRCCVELAASECRFVVDDFFEKSFGLNDQVNFHDRPFVAVFHYPPDADRPSFVTEQIVPSYQAMFATLAWQMSQKKLRAGVCFSEHLANSLSEKIDTPILTLKHPTFSSDSTWSLDCYNRRPRIVQIGEFYRDTHAIYRFFIPHVERWRLLNQQNPWVRCWDDLVARQRPNKWRGNVFEIDRVTDSEYDDLLLSSVVLSDILCASGSNVVVECIARSTPLIVSRTPSIVEYLGENYPLYLDGLSSDVQIFHEQVNRTHKYLRSMDKSWLSFSSFRSDFKRRLSAIDASAFN